MNSSLIACCRNLVCAGFIVGPGLAAHAAEPPNPAASAASASTVRAEMGPPLTAAQELLRAGKGREALAKLKEAEAFPNPTRYEAYIIERMRAPAALSAGDKPLAVQSIETLMGSDQLDQADRVPLTAALVQTAFELRDYPRSARWAQRYIEIGGTDARVRLLLPQSLYLSGDRAGAARLLQPLVDSDVAAGVRTAEVTLRMLASAQSEIHDTEGYARTLERLAEWYPKPELWSALAELSERRQPLPDRLRLDLLRFFQAVGVLTEADQFVEMAQLATLAGYPAEAARVLDDGFTRKLIGDGKDAASLQQMKAQAVRAATKDRAGFADGEASARKSGNADSLAAIGFALATDGEAARGAALIEQAITKGSLRRPDEARLHWAVALWWAGRKDDALAAMITVKGSDGSANLARLWSLFLRSPAAVARN